MTSPRETISPRSRTPRPSAYDVSARDNLAAFSDASSVSIWAQNAMQWAVAAGLIEGVTDTTIQPRGESTRAQIATILMRFQNNIAK